MTYKSFLTVWDGRDACNASLETAVRMTREAEGHLDVLCVGLDRVQPGVYYSAASPILLNDGIETARSDAKSYEEAVTSKLGSSDINWGCQSLVAQLNGLSFIVQHNARYSDLVVLPQPYGQDAADDAATVLEAALFDAGAPVLVHPASPAGDFGRKIVVAWNESDESLAAIRAAMPFLKKAEQVDITMVDPGRHSSGQSDPGMQVSQMLTRQGVNVTVTVLARTMPSIAEVLHRHANDIGADMIVMGAYGHSRLRQSFIGGATRDTLENIDMPVLMAH